MREAPFAINAFVATRLRFVTAMWRGV
jgi:hypothetical protein